MLIRRSPTVHQTVFGTDTAPSALATDLEPQLLRDLFSVTLHVIQHIHFSLLSSVRSLLLTKIHISTVILKLELSVTEGALNTTMGLFEV